MDSFNKTYRDEDDILDQIYESKYIRIFIMMISILYTILRICKLTLTVALKHYLILSIP